MPDLLLSADLMVSDPDHHAKVLSERLGVHSHPNWRQGFKTHGYVAHFLRVHKSLAVSPTRIETQHHWAVENPADPIFAEYLDSLDEFQGRFRPIKTHSCVIATDTLDELVEKLYRRRLPFRIAPIDDHLPFERLWVGTTPEQPRYRPIVDGGLCLEFMPMAPLQMPTALFGSTPPQPRDLQDGQMVRITNRAFLVRDLDDALRLLDTNLDIVASGPVELFAEEGYRRSRISFSTPGSATLDLVEPIRWDCESGRYLATWGPGPFYTRIAVNGLAAKAADLDARQTRYTRVEDSAAVGGAYLQVDAKSLDGTLVEFVEF
jgi:hypothetical protein